MKAWRVHELGEPRTALQLEEVPDPTAGPGQVLVKVLAAPANFPDVLLCRGEYQIKPPLPFTPGVELCGEVLEVGDGVTRFAVGDRVIGNPNLPGGGFAQMAVMDEANTFAAPSALDDAEASALSIGYQTSWFALHRRTQLKPGETLLVHAAAGGVGSAAVQLGKAAGAKVIGVVGGADKVEYCRRLGADLVIDRHTDDFVPLVKEFTGGRGADVVYDPVGGDAYAKSTKCIAFEGRILIIGFAGGTIPTPGLNHALIKNYSIIGLHWGLYKQYNQQAIADCHEELTRLADSGAITPLISERLSLADVADGIGRLGDGSTVGRLVFQP
ncbi:quinone oxidoreductase [Rhodococcus opacus PD630]|uniref:NADPH:quinone oxidoreductase family protein n=1 Tax=Rhodococcus opacus TaxID=37919 RepID=UPI00029CD5D6|nr:NADPH:quinone oxidoreductase family protein [Rhodococcus opacus]AHK32821.1 Quinone oxidoreductase-like protein 2 [Rhodococcus opacus PD630]EHI41216.1 quinone oxidoreductase [Rhodococcus opacus PD630]RZK84971.1 MAG: NADPH:quinone oxidoreductase family protein [Rhodococcus sp. (in: high G+C Gram-positive bacteria)]UDG95158.1 NADPH:quinone oxidoreductase family protein [Rhodococcus opacus PD630]